MIKAEWTNNDVLSAEQVTQTNEPNTLNALDCISRQAAIEAINSHFGFNVEEEYGSAVQEVINSLPPAQTEDYAELKREFILMASYIDAILRCSDEQKETLNWFISRLAKFMPWKERD